MAAPKSVVKFKKKNGFITVQYVSSVDRTEYQMHELCRAALRDVGRFIKKSFTNDYYREMGKRTGRAKGAARYSVWSSKKTIYPRVQIGLDARDVKQKGHAYFQEVGTKKLSPKKILNRTVMRNISQIIAIESQYLSYLNKEDPVIPIQEGDVDE